MEHTITPGTDAKPNTKWIWKVFWILLVVTTVEVTLAYTWPESLSVTLLNVIFISLTILKAFYIVAEFMHLGHETKSLIWSILIPIVFILWFVLAMLTEGNWWLFAREHFIG
ncbi:MAG: hypothetical protein EBS07_00445 [Sphingobacteriia bacterium]|nr:hypothetical protein [Sphingobacteriia bacterium]